MKDSRTLTKESRTPIDSFWKLNLSSRDKMRFVLPEVSNYNKLTPSKPRKMILNPNALSNNSSMIMNVVSPGRQTRVSSPNKEFNHVALRRAASQADVPYIKKSTSQNVDCQFLKFISRNIQKRPGGSITDIFKLYAIKE